MKADAKAVAESDVSETGMYGLPLEVKYCRRCTMSNQRPSSTVEFKSTTQTKKRVIAFNEDGVCEACAFAEKKKGAIDWDDRKRLLRELCDRFRRNDGRFDVIVPGSGGKDSIVAAHVLKYDYGMHPLVVTWPPHIYTEIGWRNFQAWLRGGFPNYTYWPNQKVHALLTRLAFENLVHPFQPFIVGQKNIGAKLSVLLDVPLVVYGENEAEYGNPVADNLKPTRSPDFYSSELVLDDIYLAGVCAKELLDRYKLTLADLEAYLPVDPYRLEKTKTEVHYLGYYVRWHPQETYYFSVQKTAFRPNEHRTEGSYSKYSSIDDKIDWLHYYTTHIKFGIGRATYDTAQEIRNGDITRDEGVRLIKRFDGEFPALYLKDCVEYMELPERRFYEVIEKARPPHLWEKRGERWCLRKPIWEASN